MLLISRFFGSKFGYTPMGFVDNNKKYNNNDSLFPTRLYQNPCTSTLIIVEVQGFWYKRWDVTLCFQCDMLYLHVIL